MSAVDTTHRVIKWAMTANTTSDAPPLGDARSTEQLASPPEALTEALGELTSITAARMKLSMHSLEGNVGLDSLIFAAAIGVSGIPELSRIILSAVPASKSPVDWVARHGIVFPALKHLSADIADDCRLLSPLTALLDRPAKGQDDRAMIAARYLLAWRSGKASLTLHLAQPTQDMNVRKWRSVLLDRLRLGEEHERDFVLDVYEAAMIHHREESIIQVNGARAVITDPEASSDENRLQNALSIASWWGPLWTIERSDINALRARPYLGYAYREGMALYRISRKLSGGIL